MVSRPSGHTENSKQHKKKIVADFAPGRAPADDVTFGRCKTIVIFVCKLAHNNYN